jgi:hypothetical protein
METLTLELLPNRALLIGDMKMIPKWISEYSLLSTRDQTGPNADGIPLMKVFLISIDSLI